MQYIAGKLQNVTDLRKPIFYWDDTALMGTPEALAKATKILKDCADETGLRLKWKKCHLHGTPATISKCRSLQFPGTMEFHGSFNMEYLKAPIGDDQFVKGWLKLKLQRLQEIVSLISKMPHKHEAATLMKSTAAVCRIVYLMRILPPNQISNFIKQFDTIVKSGFEQLLGITIRDLWWEVAKLPPKYGGMGWKTGSHTFAAHYITSLAKTAEAVCRITDKHNPLTIAQTNAAKWLSKLAPPNVTIKKIMLAIQNADPHRVEDNITKINLSTAQQCDAWHWKKLIPELSD